MNIIFSNIIVLNQLPNSFKIKTNQYSKLINDKIIKHFYILKSIYKTINNNIIKLKESVNKITYKKKILEDMNSKDYKIKQHLDSNCLYTQTNSSIVGNNLQNKNLPIMKSKKYLMQVINYNSITIVIAETGSGKTTKIPQLLIQNKNEKVDKIICLQPKRIATINAAIRVTKELRCILGQLVGYKIQYENYTSINTKIKFATNGIFIKELSNLQRILFYSHILIDEIHERNIGTDVVLGLIKNIIESGKKIILISATMDITKLIKNYPNAAIIKIKGNMFKISIKWSKFFVNNYYLAIAKTLGKLSSVNNNKNSLIFLPGEEDIEMIHYLLLKTIKKKFLLSILILPLYSRLSKVDQMKVFKNIPCENYKWVLATNIAETSVTINNISFVLDAGYVKVKTYVPNFLCSTLKLQLISKSSSIQRAGRAGRTQNGYCFRFYTKKLFISFMRSSMNPEIKRSELSQVILLVKSLKNYSNNPFELIDYPPLKNIESSLLILWILGFIDEFTIITEEGLLVNSIPLDVFLSKLLLNSIRFKCSYESLIVVACQQLTISSLESIDKKNSNIIYTRNHLKYLFDNYKIYKMWKNNNYSLIWSIKKKLNFKLLIKIKKLRKLLKNYLDIMNLKLISSRYFFKSIFILFYTVYFINTTKIFSTKIGIHLFTNLKCEIPSYEFNSYFTKNNYLFVYMNIIITKKPILVNGFPIKDKWICKYGAKLFKII